MIALRPSEARGAMTLNGKTMKAGDDAKIAAESLLTFSEGQGAEFLLFDLYRIQSSGRLSEEEI